MEEWTFFWIAFPFVFIIWEIGYIYYQRKKLAWHRDNFGDFLITNIPIAMGSGFAGFIWTLLYMLGGFWIAGLPAYIGAGIGAKFLVWKIFVKYEEKSPKKKRRRS